MNKEQVEERLRRAEEYDDEHPQLCWVALVMWAFGYKEEDPLEEPEAFSQACTEESWYCGKCVVTGRIKQRGEVK